MSRLEPIYGYGFFRVDLSGLVDETIVFLYYDPERLYARIRTSKRDLEKELRTLADNMQYYLDMEKVYINNQRVYPKVEHVEIGPTVKEEIAYIVYNISFKGILRKGLNTYVDEYEEETSEYEYIVYWLFPEGSRIVRASLDVPYNIIMYGRGLVFKVPKGVRLKGREEIVFEIT
ncbi:hypothetical protein ACSU1N_05070 [Thermogladius sp. 4427co]|uniref:hypothetical protein n=1 Tax=Thermogladius sp. 4427co TaxID=3450718 RepID=UPI003F78F78F